MPLPIESYNFLYNLLLEEEVVYAHHKIGCCVDEKK